MRPEVCDVDEHDDGMADQGQSVASAEGGGWAKSLETKEFEQQDCALAYTIDRRAGVSFGGLVTVRGDNSELPRSFRSTFGWRWQFELTRKFEVRWKCGGCR